MCSRHLSCVASGVYMKFMWRWYLSCIIIGLSRKFESLGPVFCCFWLMHELSYVASGWCTRLLIPVLCCHLFKQKLVCHWNLPCAAVGVSRTFLSLRPVSCCFWFMHKVRVLSMPVLCCHCSQHEVCVCHWTLSFLAFGLCKRFVCFRYPSYVTVVVSRSSFVTSTCLMLPLAYAGRLCWSSSDIVTRLMFPLVVCLFPIGCIYAIYSQ